MKTGLKRMFLHAYSIAFAHPLTGEPMFITAPLPPELAGFITRLDLELTSKVIFPSAEMSS
jgi:23S rRNA pseudouridine955/2504/2580 synthase